MSIIEVNNLTKKFGDIEAVKGISFKVEEGEVFGFLGPNGAGKTTTINILCTLLNPTSGEAVLNNFNVVNNPNEVRRSIGLVFQDPSLDERLTARENLEFHAMIYNVPRSERNERIKNVLEMVELSERQNDLVRNYSGGMKRRLEIARGLLHYPKVLFLDEPTIGLDPQTRNHIWTHIRELKKKENVTVFLTTHYMDEAENCSRIAVIDYGEIVALDTPSNLKAQVGGDVLTLKTGNDEIAALRLKEDFGLDVKLVPSESEGTNSSGIYFEIENGDKFIPKLIKEADLNILSINLRKPTLDDVFLKLTGHAIREEKADVSTFHRAHMRMGRR
ncbi:MAG: ATP-binding cassette domain-containing protein [Actinobacteria bacterium]|nr:ATP-binding cassette domain-containing protein [Actinomycetota bacterium]